MDHFMKMCRYDNSNNHFDPLGNEKFMKSFYIHNYHTIRDALSE